MKKNLRILLTDDNKEFSDNLKDILELKGYEVVLASDGFKALEIIRATDIDLILMDIKMPVMNGVETFKQMKTIVPSTPVIMMTAFAVEELIHESLHEGAFACLKKPLDFDEFFTSIENALSHGAMILVVDDDEHLCRSLADVLGNKGYRISVAYDSASALEKVKKNRFDILLLDMKLPALNGFETYQELRAIRPDLVVIIITGSPSDMEKLVNNVKDKGAYTLIEKPIQMDSLLNLLEKIQKSDK